MLYGRERFQCAVTERMCADSGRIYADNSQEMHRQRKWVRCLTELCRCSVRCECALTATETLRGEGMCAKCGGGYAETTFRECTDQRKWVRCLTELCRCSMRCECALTATETLRGEGMRANSGGTYAEIARTQQSETLCKARAGSHLV